MIPPGTMLHEIRAANPGWSEEACRAWQERVVVGELQRMGVTHVIASPEYLAAHEAWDRAWRAIVAAKRKYAPGAVPLEEQGTLEADCDAAAGRYKAAWGAELRRQRALGRVTA